MTVWGCLMKVRGSKAPPAFPAPYAWNPSIHAACWPQTSSQRFLPPRVCSERLVPVHCISLDQFTQLVRIYLLTGCAFFFPLSAVINCSVICSNPPHLPPGLYFPQYRLTGWGLQPAPPITQEQASWVQVVGTIRLKEAELTQLRACVHFTFLFFIRSLSYFHM